MEARVRMETLIGSFWRLTWAVRVMDDATGEWVMDEIIGDDWLYHFLSQDEWKERQAQEKGE